MKRSMGSNEGMSVGRADDNWGEEVQSFRVSFLILRCVSLIRCRCSLIVCSRVAQDDEMLSEFESAAEEALAQADEEALAQAAVDGDPKSYGGKRKVSCSLSLSLSLARSLALSR